MPKRHHQPGATYPNRRWPLEQLWARSCARWLRNPALGPGVSAPSPHSRRADLALGAPHLDSPTVWIVRCGPRPCRNTRPRPSGNFKSFLWATGMLPRPAFPIQRRCRFDFRAISALKAAAAMSLFTVDFFQDLCSGPWSKTPDLLRSLLFPQSPADPAPSARLGGRLVDRIA